MRPYRLYVCKTHPVDWRPISIEEAAKPREDVLATDKSPEYHGWILTSDGWACKWCRENNPRVMNGLVA